MAEQMIRRTFIEFYELIQKTLNDFLLEISLTIGFLPLLKWACKRSDNGMTPLHLVAIKGNLKLCQVLVNCDAYDKNLPNSYGQTPLHMASKYGHLEICKTILDAVADKNPMANNGWTPLHIAAKNGHIKICDLISKHTEDSNPPDIYGITPLDIADFKNHTKICKLIGNLSRKNPSEFVPRIYEYEVLDKNIVVSLKKLLASTKCQKLKDIGVCNGLSFTFSGGCNVIKKLTRISNEISGYKCWTKLRKDISIEDSGKLEINCFRSNIDSYWAWSCNRIELAHKKCIQIAYAYAKTYLNKIDPSNNFFSQKMDINISEVKDNAFTTCVGSSAGCVYAAALISLALQKPICQNLAMTGQISSQGKIGPVGYIDKKITAAIKAGLKTVIIPKGNKKDFQALPTRIKKNVTVYYAKTFEDISQIIFEPDAQRHL